MQYPGLKYFFFWKEHYLKFKNSKQIAKMHKSSNCPIILYRDEAKT